MTKTKKKIVWETIGDFRSMPGGGVSAEKLVKALEESLLKEERQNILIDSTVE